MPSPNRVLSLISVADQAMYDAKSHAADVAEPGVACDQRGDDAVVAVDVGAGGVAQVAGDDRLHGGPADAGFGFSHQAAGTHGTVFAAGRIRPDGTGLHAYGPVKGGFNTIAFGLFKHLSSGFTGGEISDINFLFFIL